MFSASHITYYHLCHRKLWLHHQGMRMEDNSSAVAEGQLIGENTYQRRSKKWKELSLDGLKIDHYDPKENKIREVKKSPKLELAHIAQVKFYLYALEQRGIKNAGGRIEYPKQKRNREVQLSEEDRQQIKEWIKTIQQIVAQPDCPDLIEKTYCKNCAFRDFCYI